THRKNRNNSHNQACQWFAVFTFVLCVQIMTEMSAMVTGIMLRQRQTLDDLRERGALQYFTAKIANGINRNKSIRPPVHWVSARLRGSSRCAVVIDCDRPVWRRAN